MKQLRSRNKKKKKQVPKSLQTAKKPKAAAKPAPKPVLKKAPTTDKAKSGSKTIRKPEVDPKTGRVYTDTKPVEQVKTSPTPVSRGIGLTIRQISRQSDRKAFERALRVKIGNIQRGLNRKGQPTVLAKTWTTEDDDGTPRSPKDYYRTRVTSISVYPPGHKHEGKPMKISEGRVLVACSCAYFPFWGCEVPLNAGGSARIHYSNGEEPVVRNPLNKKRVCKHLLKLFDLIMQRGW